MVPHAGVYGIKFLNLKEKQEKILIIDLKNESLNSYMTLQKIIFIYLALFLKFY